MGWLFKVEKEDDDAELAKRLEFDFKIRDIRRRIEKLRENFHTPRRVRVEEPPEVDEQAQNTRQQRDKDNEINEIKAKLLGRKK
jgi:RNA processing factor Prp31